MAIAFRTSSAAGASSGSQVTSQNLTIPAAVLAGDVMLLVTYALTSLGTASTLTVSSTGTQFTQVASSVHVTSGGFTANTAIWKCVATAADAGKVITASSGSDVSFWGMAVGAWSGVSPSAPVDVAPAGFTVAGTSTIACPAATTATAGDWAVYMLGVTASGVTPTAPAGTTTRETQYGGTNVGALIADSNGSVGGAGTSIGGGTFAAGGSTATWWAAWTVGLKPAGTFDPYFVSTDGNGVQTWNVTYTGNQPYTYPTSTPTGTGLRILPPAAPSPAYPACFVYDLPVNNGFDDTTNGNGLDTIRGLAAQNTYHATIIEPSFGISPWYADKDSDATLHLESFMTALRAWMATSSFASGGEKHYLIGFSKSGLGGSGLLFKHADLWTAGAFWDMPAMMTDYDGTDPTFGSTVGGSPAFNYGSSANFQANYRLSTANITAWNTAAGGSFSAVRRLWVGGYFSFQADINAYMSLLTGLGILYDGSWNTVDASHAWHSDWVAPALASIIHAPPVTGSGGVTGAPLSVSGTGAVSIATPGVLTISVAPDGRLAAGQAARVSATVRDLGGTLATPGTLTLTLKKPDGTLKSYAAPLSDDTGLYHQDILPGDLSQVGHYALKWVSTGTAAGVAPAAFDVYDPFEPCVISLQDAKDMLNIPQATTKDDAEIAEWIAAIESGLERRTGGPVISRTVTERAELDGTHTVLLLRQRPLVSVTSIVAVASGQAIDISGGLDVDVNAGTVRTAIGWPFLGPYWRGRPVMLVTYVAGWGTSVPPAFSAFARIVVKHMWDTQRPSVGMPMGGEQTVMIPGFGFAVPARAAELLDGSQDGIPFVLEAYV